MSPASSEAIMYLTAYPTQAHSGSFKEKTSGDSISQPLPWHLFDDLWRNFTTVFAIFGDTLLNTIIQIVASLSLQFYSFPGLCQDIFLSGLKLKVPISCNFGSAWQNKDFSMFYNDQYCYFPVIFPDVHLM